MSRPAMIASCHIKKLNIPPLLNECDIPSVEICILLSLAPSIGEQRKPI